MRTELQVSVKALIKDERGRYLILRRTYPHTGEREASRVYPVNADPAKTGHN